jgi:hypothetical protein
LPPRDGSLINDHGTIYIIGNGARAGFANEQTFLGLGYSYANVIPGDTSFMQTLPPYTSPNTEHPFGTLVKSNSTLYIIHNGNREAFASMDVLNSWGYRLGEAVPANSYDLIAPVDAIASLRTSEQLNYPNNY